MGTGPEPSHLQPKALSPTRAGRMEHTSISASSYWLPQSRPVLTPLPLSECDGGGTVGWLGPLEPLVSLSLGQQTCIPGSCHLRKYFSPFRGGHMARQLSEP